MKKYLSIVLALTLILTVFAGCGAKSAPEEKQKKTEVTPKSDEQLIKDDLLKAFSMDNYDEMIAAGLKQDAEFVAVAEEAGLDIDEYVNAFASKYKWDIGDISVDGDKALAKITMTCPDFEKMDVILDQKLDDYMANNDTSNLSESDAKKLVCDIMLEIVKADDLPLTSEDFNIDYSKEDGTWKMVDSPEVEKAMIEAQGISEAN